MNAKSVEFTGPALVCLLLLHLAGVANAADGSSARKPVLPSGRPVTAEMFVRLGAPLQAELNGQWFAAQAIGLLADGNVKIHWVGLASQADEALPRGRLMFAIDPLAGSAMVGQPRGPRMANRPQSPFVPLPNGQNPPPQDPPAAPPPARPTRVTRAAMADMTLDQLIEIIKQRETFSIQAALRELTSRKPEEPSPAVSKALESLVLGKDFSVSWSAAEPWEHWATEESVPGLIQALNNTSPFVTGPAMKALARLQSEDAIQPIVEALQELGKVQLAADALKLYGSKAEPAVLDLIKRSKDHFTVVRACELLADIGTSKSFPTLTVLQKDFFTQDEATSAMQAIQSRSGKPPTKKKKGK